MNGIFDLIMDNLFFVIIIIGVLMRFLGGSKAKQEQEEETSNPRQRQATEQEPRPKSVFEQMKEELEKQTKQVGEQKQVKQARTQASSAHVDSQKRAQKTLSIEEQRAAQIEKLKQKIPSHSGMQNNNQVIESNPKRKGSKVAVNFNKKLTRKGLIESVVMAEVLGQPRALKPYRNIASNRYK